MVGWYTGKDRNAVEEYLIDVVNLINDQVITEQCLFIISPVLITCYNMTMANPISPPNTLNV